jgi:hypothetical protein
MAQVQANFSIGHVKGLLDSINAEVSLCLCCQMDWSLFNMDLGSGLP